MKKSILFTISLLLLLVFCTTACATTFTKTVQCTNENDYVRSDTSGEKQLDDHRIVVRYNAQNCSNSYTNHFRGYMAEENALCGSKWVTPGGNYYIQGSGFCDGWHYYLTMRGNTKYHQYEGLSSIVLSGWFLPDY